jgi:hypothetical protein
MCHIKKRRSAYKGFYYYYYYYYYYLTEIGLTPGGGSTVHIYTHTHTHTHTHTQCTEYTGRSDMMERDHLKVLGKLRG